MVERLDKQPMRDHACFRLGLRIDRLSDALAADLEHLRGFKALSSSDVKRACAGLFDLVAAGKVAVRTTDADLNRALDAAVAAADPADRIVVFGSFFTVGGILANGIPRLDAPHLSS